MKLLTAFLDMDYCPVSYDAITWLVRAMFERDERGCDSLHVVIVPNGKTGFAREWGKHDEAATHWRMWHIVIPACQLAGATVTLAPTRKWCDFQYETRTGLEEIWWPFGKAHFMGPLVDAARPTKHIPVGKKIPKLRATDAARRYVAGWSQKKIITVTVRCQDTDADRNSNSKAFVELLEWLDDEGRTLIVNISDTHAVLQYGSSEWDLPALDIDLRLALYERAAMNIIGNNGPQELLKFSDAPYLAFGQGLGGMGADHWRKYFHMELGEQLPWANANQKLCFVPDTFENMRGEFEAWERVA